MPDGVMGHVVGSRGGSGLRGPLRGVRTLTGNSWKVHSTPNSAKDCNGQEFGLKCMVALNKGSVTLVRECDSPNCFLGSLSLEP